MELEQPVPAPVTDGDDRSRPFERAPWRRAITLLPRS